MQSLLLCRPMRPPLHASSHHASRHACLIQESAQSRQEGSDEWAVSTWTSLLHLAQQVGIIDVELEGVGDGVVAQLPPTPQQLGIDRVPQLLLLHLAAQFQLVTRLAAQLLLPLRRLRPPQLLLVPLPLLPLPRPLPRRLPLHLRPVLLLRLEHLQSVRLLRPLQLLVVVALVVEYVLVLLGRDEMAQLLLLQLRLVYEQFAAVFLLFELPLQHLAVALSVLLQLLHHSVHLAPLFLPSRLPLPRLPTLRPLTQPLTQFLPVQFLHFARVDCTWVGIAFDGGDEEGVAAWGEDYSLVWMEVGALARWLASTQLELFLRTAEAQRSLRMGRIINGTCLFATVCHKCLIAQQTLVTGVGWVGWGGGEGWGGDGHSYVSVLYNLMINYNESKYDLPLQPRSPFSSLSNIARTASKDLPRQLSNDLFRQESTHNKENRPIIQTAENAKNNPTPQYSTKQKAVQPKIAEKAEQRGIVRERSDHLRNIIRKQLFCQGRDNLEKMESCKNVIVSEAVEKPKEQDRENRYKKLLSEFYGDPTKYSNQITRKGKKENTSNPTPAISRHQSMKKLVEPQPQGLKRNHSNCSLKPNSFLRQKPALPKQPSYLQLYWQRRSPQLFL